MSGIPSFGWSLLLMAVLAGCHDPLTQVVVVFQSDLVIPTEVDGVGITASEGPFAPDSGAAAVNLQAALLGVDFPLSLGIDSAGSTPTFSMTVQLILNLANHQPPPVIVVSRTVTDIRFVDQQTVMLVLPLLRACACQGTSCPSPGDPQCDNIDGPTLQPFDATVAPPSTMMPVGGINIVPHPPTTPRP